MRDMDTCTEITNVFTGEDKYFIIVCTIPFPVSNRDDCLVA